MAMHKWANMTKILQLAIPCWLLVERGFKGCQSLFFSIELKKVSLEQCVNHFTPDVMGRILSERSQKLSKKICSSKTWYWVIFSQIWSFLVACTWLCKSLSVGQSFQWSIGPSVHHTLLFLRFQAYTVTAYTVACTRNWPCWGQGFLYEPKTLSKT